MRKDEDALELSGPLLRAAWALQSLGEVQLSEAANKRILLALRIANARASVAKPHRSAIWGRPAIALALATSATVGLGLTSVYAAGDALPGSPLYTVRGVREHVQVALASGSAERARLYVEFAAARTHELHQKLIHKEELAPADLSSLLRDVSTLSHDASQESRSADAETQLTVKAAEAAVADELMETKQAGTLTADENNEVEQTVHTVAAAEAEVSEPTVAPEATPGMTPDPTSEPTP